MNQTVSVIITAKNYGHYLPTAINSALAQTRPPDEIVIVDDGSTDHTPSVLQQYANHPRIIAIRVDGLGVCRARNLAIERSSGELLAFLDADDRWHPQKLAKQLPLFSAAKVGVVYARRQLINPHGEPLATPATPLPSGNLFDTLIRTNPICFSSAIVRRQVIEHVGGFDPTLPLAVDYDLWLRIAPFYEFAVIADEVLVDYRTGHANLSSRLVERVETIFHILNRTVNRRDLPTRPTPEALTDAYASTCRSMGYALRKHNRWRSARWYLHAATHDGHWLQSLKGAVGSLVKSAR